MLSDIVVSLLADRLVEWAGNDASVGAFADAVDAHQPDLDPLFMNLTLNVCRASVADAQAYWFERMQPVGDDGRFFNTLRDALYDPTFVNTSAVIHHLITNQYIWDVVFGALYPLLEFKSGADVRAFFQADFFKPLAKIAALAARPFVYANGGGDWAMYCGTVPDAWPFASVSFLCNMKESASTRKVFIARFKASGAWLLLSLRSTTRSQASSGLRTEFYVNNLLSEKIEWNEDVGLMYGAIAYQFAHRRIIYSAEDGALQHETADAQEKSSLLITLPDLDKFDLAVYLGDYLEFGVAKGAGRAVFNMDRFNIVARFMRLLDVDAANPKFLRGHRIQKVWWLIHNDKQARKAFHERDLVQLKFRVLQLFGLERKDPFETDAGFWGRTWGDTMELIELICEVAMDDKRDMREFDCTPVTDPRYTTPTVPLDALAGLDLVDAPAPNPDAAWEAEAAALGRGGGVQSGDKPAAAVEAAGASQPWSGMGGAGLMWEAAASSEEEEEKGAKAEGKTEAVEKTGFTPPAKRGKKKSQEI